MNAIAVTVFVTGWILIGLITGLWMARHGHSPLWTGIAVVLGPLFVPIALERVERRPRLASSGPDGNAPVGTDPTDRPRLMVGMDGSPESEHALDTALAIMGTRCGTLMLAEVVSYDDAAEGASTAALVDAASARLARAAARVLDVATRYEVLAGPPGETLRRFAQDQSMDLLVVGRHGRDLSARLMGSVSSDLVHHATVPVLVVEPLQVGPTAPDLVATGVTGPESSGDADGLR